MERATVNNQIVSGTVDATGPDANTLPDTISSSLSAKESFTVDTELSTDGYVHVTVRAYGRIVQTWDYEA